MNAGLTNLTTLRRHLLAASLQSEARFDTVLVTLGRGVAAAFESYCNRSLGFEEDAEMVVGADRSHVVVPVYPIVAVSAVALKRDEESGWVPQADEPLIINTNSGLVRFSGQMGSEWELLRITWTGGYWWEQAEPEDETFPSAAPEGAARLPDDLVSAFLLQCEMVWEAHDKLGTSMTSGGTQTDTRLSKLDLSPLVKSVLDGYIRYQLS